MIDNVCQACGQQRILQPGGKGSSVGGIVLRGRLRRRERAIVVSQSEQSVTLFMADGSVGALDATQFASDWRPARRSKATSHDSVAYQLLTICREQEGRWDLESARRVALELARADTNDARQLARAIAREGDRELLGIVLDLPISASEQTWIAMHTHVAAGDSDAAIAAATSLPEDGYPDKLGVLAAGLAQGAVSPSDAHRHAVPFSDLPEGRLISALAESEGSRDESSDWVSAAAALADLLRARGDEDGAEELEVLRTAAINPGALQASDLAKLGEGTESLTLAWQLLYGSIPKLAVPSDGLDQAVVDELIERGVLHEATDDAPDPYLLARLSPERLSDDDLEALGFAGEQARRAFMATRPRVLAALSDAHPDDRIVRRYALAMRARQGDAEACSELANTVDESREAETARSLAKALADGNVEAGLLKDETVFPVLLSELPPDSLSAGAGPALDRYLTYSSLHRAKDAIHTWNWSAAAESAREVLRIAVDEPERDEALNVLAYAQYALGNGEAAIGALEKALEGHYTPAMQTNIGVVAGLLDPQSAARHLGKLAQEAPTLGLRASAAMRSIELWSATSTPWDDDDNDEEEEEQVDDLIDLAERGEVAQGRSGEGAGEQDEARLPESLRSAVRALVCQHVTLGQHIAMVRTLAQFDREWFGDPSNSAASPHSDTAIHRVLVARATSHEDYIDVLVRELQGDPQDGLLLEERDSFIATLRELMFDDEPHVGAAFFAHHLVEAGMPLEPWDEIVLTAGSTAVIAGGMDPDEGIPSEKLFDRLEQARSLLSEVPHDEHERASGLLTHAYESYAAVLHDSLLRPLREIQDAGNHIASHIGSVGWFDRIDYGKLREATDPMKQMLHEADLQLDAVLPHVRDDELREGVGNLQATTRELYEWLGHMGSRW